MSKMTILSAGALLVDVLANDAELSQNCNKVFPIVSEEGAELPYICYRRQNITPTVYKGGQGLSGANTANYEVVCFAETEAQSLVMAERVAELLDGKSYVYTDDHTGATLVARSIVLVNADELWQGDAYAQNLQFQIKI